jgi:hypothetical protein
MALRIIFLESMTVGEKKFSKATIQMQDGTVILTASFANKIFMLGALVLKTKPRQR